MDNKPKILIVDDKPENLVALSVVLKDLDVVLIKANNGNEALRATLHHDFALALLDIQMPDMDGFELAEILRQEEKTSRLPFIFISAVYTDNLDIFKGYEKGAFSFITKPFQPEILINKVKFFIEKYKQEIELKELNEDLISTNTELEQFAYVASHDLQEPLRTISNFVGLLQEKYVDINDKDTGQYLDFIVDATSRMQRLIKDLLDFSRVGKDLSFEMVDCNKILNEVILNLNGTIKDSNAKITFSELPVLNGCEIELSRLFQNLISNAIKFQEPENVPEIKISFEENDDEYVFSVQDNGIGIEKQYIKKLFIIFQRLHTIDEYPGTGIGSAICKKIVELHNGKIWAESKLGEGSTFRFTISKALSK